MSRALNMQSVLNYAWEQHVKFNGAAMQASARVGQSSITEKIFFKWSDWARKSLDFYILGGVLINGSRKMARTLPWQHPVKPWFYACDIAAVEPQRFLNKNTTGPAGPYSEHDRVLLTIVFQPSPCPMLSDDGLRNGTSATPDGTTGEWNRFTIRETENLLQVGSREGSSYIYTEGSNTVALDNSGPTKNVTEFRGPIPYLLPRRNVVVTWMYVHPDYITDPTTERQLKFEECHGKVNDRLWWGYYTGTLMLKTWKVIREPLPYKLPDVADYKPMYLNRVISTFDHYDPPIDDLAGNTTRGHQTAPWPFNNKNYAIKSKANGNGDNTPPFATANFSRMFDHVLAP